MWSSGISEEWLEQSSCTLAAMCWYLHQLLLKKIQHKMLKINFKTVFFFTHVVARCEPFSLSPPHLSLSLSLLFIVHSPRQRRKHILWIELMEISEYCFFYSFNPLEARASHGANYSSFFRKTILKKLNFHRFNFTLG